MVAFLANISFFASAQMKIAHTNVDLIVSQMPELRAADNEMNTFGRKLEEQIRAKEADMQKKREELEARVASMTEEQMIAAQQDWQNTMRSFQEFQSSAEEQFNKKRADLLQPIYEKVQKVIEEVAKENGYDYVINDANGQVILFGPKEHDITNKVFAKLGIDPANN